MKPSEGSLSTTTDLLVRSGAGDRKACDELLPHIYEELRRIAQLQLRTQRQGHTLQPTALVHEAFIRLVDGSCATWENKTHFVRLGAKVMRCILVDQARARSRKKRGGGIELLSLHDVPEPICVPLSDLIALDDALTKLAGSHPRPAEVVELMHFGGLTVDQTATELGISRRTALRDWRFARAWLLRLLSPGS